MIQREAGLEEMYQRLKAVYQEIGIKHFRRNPTKAVGKEKYPALFMDEGVDNIIDPSKRTSHGYPARRACEVIFEINTTSEMDIRALYGDVRKALFTVRETDPPVFSPIIAQNIFFREVRTEGPSGVNVPDVLIMSLVVELIYTDNPFSEDTI